MGAAIYRSAAIESESISVLTVIFGKFQVINHFESGLNEYKYSWRILRFESKYIYI